MAPKSTALTTKVTEGSPYQLSQEQTLKAAGALLKHIKVTDSSATEPKPNLLAGGEDEEDQSLAIWFQVTTKKHITDTKRLKPGKIAVPHPLNTSPSTTICLITADPQRTYKDIVASPAFPASLAARITRVVGVDKIKKKWTQYEAQRKLYSEHDIFLADDRIITLLPKLLGKTFYQKTTKRPIPVNLQAAAPRTDGKRIARAKESKGGSQAGTPQHVATEIERAVQGYVGAPLALDEYLCEGRIRILGRSTDRENVAAVADAMVEKYVPKKWRGVKSMHIKGAKTAALPIWLADELWEDETEVLDEETALERKRIEEEAAAASAGKKRKGRPTAAITEAGEEVEEEGGKKKRKTSGEGEKKSKQQQQLVKSNDDKLDKEIALRKEELKKQKEEAALDVEDGVPKPTKKAKKSKA